MPLAELQWMGYSAALTHLVPLTIHGYGFYMPRCWSLSIRECREHSRAEAAPLANQAGAILRHCPVSDMQWWPGTGNPGLSLHIANQARAQYHRCPWAAYKATLHTQCQGQICPCHGIFMFNIQRPWLVAIAALATGSEFWAHGAPLTSA